MKLPRLMQPHVLPRQGRTLQPRRRLDPRLLDSTQPYGTLRAMKANVIRHVLNLWPPFLFSGIHVAAVGEDYRHARVELRMRPWNRNYVGTHFGGSLFAMTDPFWMLLVMQALGRDYIVWDRSGSIDFVKPGRGTVQARFDLDESVLDQLRHAAAGGGKVLHWFDTDVVDAEGAVVAKVRKQLYVRLKRARGVDAAASDQSAADIRTAAPAATGADAADTLSKVASGRRQ